MRRYISTAVLILGLPVGVAAQTALEACRDQIFDRVDANSDGVLVPTEAASQPLGMDSRVFAVADRNQDGIIDYGEYKKLAVFVSCELCPAIADCSGSE